MTTVLEISSQSFQSEVIDSSTPVSVYFWAPWYSPCHKNMPLLEDMSRKLKDKIVFVKLNIDQNDTLAVTHLISIIPTLLLFKDGVEVKRIIGVCSQDELEYELTTLF